MINVVMRHKHKVSIYLIRTMYRFSITFIYMNLCI